MAFIQFGGVSRSFQSLFGLIPFRTFPLPIEPSITDGDMTEMPDRILRDPNARPIPGLADSGICRIAAPPLACRIGG